MNASCLGTSTAHRAQTYADQGATRGSPIPQTPACSHRSGRSIRRQYTARALLLLQPQVEKTAERVSHPAVLACDVAGTVSRLVVTLSTIKLLLLLLAPVCAPASAPQQSEADGPQAGRLKRAWQTVTRRRKRASTDESTQREQTIGILLQQPLGQTTVLNQGETLAWLCVHSIALTLAFFCRWMSEKLSRWLGLTPVKTRSITSQELPPLTRLAALQTQQDAQTVALERLERQVNRLQVVSRMYRHDVGKPLRQTQVSVAGQAEMLAQLSLSHEKLGKQVLELQALLSASQGTSAKQFTVLVRAIESTQQQQQALSTRIQQASSQLQALQTLTLSSGFTQGTYGTAYSEGSMVAVTHTNPPPDPWLVPKGGAQATEHTADSQSNSGSSEGASGSLTGASEVKESSEGRSSDRQQTWQFRGDPG